MSSPNGPGLNAAAEPPGIPLAPRTARDVTTRTLGNRRYGRLGALVLAVPEVALGDGTGP
jgi:hypothetical protein